MNLDVSSDKAAPGQLQLQGPPPGAGRSWLRVTGFPVPARRSDWQLSKVLVCKLQEVELFIIPI